MPRHAATVCFASLLGLVEVECADTGVTRVRLGARGKPREVGDGAAMDHARRTRSEILAYLEGRLRDFTVPLVLGGTPFQQAVWGRLRAIPYGRTRTYGQVAAELGKPRAARAVGTACGSNPLAILVPCHRIVSGNGSTGAGSRIKTELRALEQARER